MNRTFLWCKNCAVDYFVLSQCRRLTDGQMDRRQISIARSCLYIRSRTVQACDVTQLWRLHAIRYVVRSFLIPLVQKV